MSNFNSDKKSDIINCIAAASLFAIGLSFQGTLWNNFFMSIGTDLTRSSLQSHLAKLQKYWLSNDGALNHEIQRVLSHASAEALENLEKKYIEKVERSIAYNEKKAIQKNFSDLNKQVEKDFLTSLEKEATEEDVKNYIYGNAEKAIKEIGDCISSTKFLGKHSESFSNFFTENYFSELQHNFHELLKKDDEESKKAWIVFQRLLLQDIHTDINKILLNIDVNPHILLYANNLFKEICTACAKKDKNILVIGDVMLDYKIKATFAKYEDVQKHQILFKGGEVYMVSDESKTLGGAADISMALSKISNVTLIGVIGSDCEGKTLQELCKKNKIRSCLEQNSKVKTTTKIYIHRMTEKGEEKILRFDSEDIKSMTSYCQIKDVRDKLIDKIKKCINTEDNKVDCIVIKDHQKGMISTEIVREIAKVASNEKIPLYVDPKYNWQIFKDVMINSILPNMKEAASALYDIKSEEGKILEKDLNCKLENAEYISLVTEYPMCKNFVIKAASEGAIIMSQSPDVYPKDSNPLLVEERKVINPFLVDKRDFETDVGCGDVFDAFMIIGMLNNYNLVKSALFANFVAGLKTKKSLGEHMSLDDIKDEMKKKLYEKYIADNLLLINDEIFKPQITVDV
jgi:D-beta-D-heptose 7-phosphate kinase/D-beta-D-heptose 1-phosphate adenosyltransferase